MRVFLLLLVVACVGTLSFWMFGRHVMATASGGQLAAVLEVQPGARLRPVLLTLAHEKVVRYPNVIYAMARLHKQTRVQSGMYKVAASQTPAEILAMLREGKVLLDRVTVPEGLNRWQVRDILVKKQWLSAKQFDTLCDDQAFLQQSHVPGPSCEGYLYPETYTLRRGSGAKEIFAAFFAAYRAQVKKAMAHVQAPLHLSEREFTTLASIVEKETGAPHERPHIACIFYNRMTAKPPWKLETDPTVIYAATLLDPNFNGNITRYHLHKMMSPYNTYMVTGLPPGPISNPGAGALHAVAQPMHCPDYFFVSKNHGEHIFCPTLACHLAGVKKWQVDYFRRARAGLPLPTDDKGGSAAQGAPAVAPTARERRAAQRRVGKQGARARKGRAAAPAAKRPAKGAAGRKGSRNTPNADEDFERAWQ